MDRDRVKRTHLRTYSSELFNLARRILLRIPVRDTQCGLKVMNTAGIDVLRKCRENTWFLDMEFLARAHAAKLRIKEVPVDWDEYRFPKRKSKLNVVRDGILAIIAMLRIRIGMLP